MDENTDTSLSFLEPLKNNNSLVNQPIPSILVSPTVIDPDFINCILSIPKKIEKLFCSKEKINYVYKIVNNEFIFINFTSKDIEKIEIFVDYFEKFDFNKNPLSSIIFIIGRQKYFIHEKNENIKKYKKCIQNNLNYSESNIYKELRQKYFKYQIEKNMNIIYIENSIELHETIKNISVIAQKDKKYLPKVKSYTKEKKHNLMMSLLKQISGISENVAKSLYEEYEDLKKLRKKLIEEESKMKDLNIYDEDRLNKRVLGDKIVQKLKKALLSENMNENI